MTRVVVLGASGMLGSMLLDVLSADGAWDIAGTVRSSELAAACRARIPDAEWRVFDVREDEASLRQSLRGADWVVNAIGLTKPHIHDDEPAEVEAAIGVNAAFPFRLAREAAAVDARVLQIVTDCVYSGSSGRYVESSPHDALDVYGKTKSLGEPRLPNVHLLRCSIIGPEPKTNAFLLEWLRGQPANARVSGYVDHLWNGVTTLTFARLCAGLVGGADVPADLQHVIPAADVTKADLVADIARAYGRHDITIERVSAPSPVDRTLRTEHPDALGALWTAAGYTAPPSVPEMVAELATHPYRLAGLSP